MPRRWLLAIPLALALVTPAPVFAQNTSIFEFRDGVVLSGTTGSTDDLELSTTELATVIRRVQGLAVGIVMPDPKLAGEDAKDRDEAIATAATRRLAEASMGVQRCLVDADTTAADCVDQLFQADVKQIILIGDLGDLTAATETPIANRVPIVSIGNTTIAEGGVTLSLDAVGAGTQLGTAAGKTLGVATSKRKGNALVLTSQDPDKPDDVRDAIEAGLRKTAPAVKIAGEVGPVEIHTVDDLVAQLPRKTPISVVTGDGIALDGATVDGLAALPKKLKVLAWTCTPAVTEILDFATQVRGCVASAEDAAGEAAADVLLTIKAGRDVAAEIQVPTYVYRGTIPVGPGSVELGRSYASEYTPVTDDEKAQATAELAGRPVGIIVPVAADDAEPADQKAIRTGIEAAITAAGGTVETCVGTESKASACMTRLTDEGVAAIIPIGTRADLTAAATAAIKADIPVIGVNEITMGDAGVVYIIVNPRTVARLSGRMAGAYAERIWKDMAVDAVTFNDVGAASNDTISAAVERALHQTDSNATVAARIASKGKSKIGSAVKTLLKRYPSTLLIVGKNAAAAAPELIKYKFANPDLKIFAQDCTPDTVAAIDAGVGTGGRILGCVDRNPTGMGALAGEVLTRMLAGGTIPEIIESPVLPYQPGVS
ncbi:MAG: hypothetical protein U0869_23305 [Chloroflexota bacterium]